MRQKRAFGRCAAAAGILWMAVAPVTTAEQVEVRSGERDGRTVELRVAPPAGIRGYGFGAKTLDPSALTALPGDAAAGGGGRALASTRLSGTPMAGDVRGIALTPDGSTVIYAADQDTLGIVELYAVPADASAGSIKLSAGLALGAGDQGVAEFQIAPGGTTVVFLADPEAGAGSNDVYSVPVDGSSAPTRLSTATQRPVAAFGIGPNGTTVGYLAKDTSFGGGGTELYRATVGSVSSGVQLSDASAIAGGNTVAADFTSDGARLLYAADAATDGIFQWYSVLTTATGPGADVRLSNVLSTLTLGALSPNGSTLAYAGDQTTMGRFDLYSVPVAGGTAVKLTPAIAGIGVTALAFGPNGTRVAYLADQVTVDVFEVFSATVGVASSGVRLNTPLSGTQSADELTVGPDGTVLYEADENTAGTYDLLAAPIDGSGSSLTLHGMTPPANAASFASLGTPVVGMRVVYPVTDSGSVDLYSVPIDGSAAPAMLNDVPPAGETVLNAYVPNVAQRLMAYGLGPGATTSIWAVPVRDDFAPEQANVTAGAGSLGVTSYWIDSGERWVVYVQDQSTAGTLELWAAELDSDQDTIGNASDNCPYVSNPLQDPVVFGDTVTASSKTTFAWGTAIDARYVRGPLSGVAALVTDDTGTLLGATSYEDVATPPASDGFFYLFAVDCAGRTYQTAVGAEPGRDAALP